MQTMDELTAPFIAAKCNMQIRGIFINFEKNGKKNVEKSSHQATVHTVQTNNEINFDVILAAGSIQWEKIKDKSIPVMLMSDD